MKRIILILFVAMMLTIQISQAVESTNQTKIYKNVKDSRTNIIGGLLLLLGLFFVIVGGFEMWNG